ncbi:aminotransferase [Streptococcus rifensis]
MQLPVFGVEEWLNQHEMSAVYDIAGVSIASLTLEEIIALGPLSPENFFDQLVRKKMDYGWIEGSPEFKEVVSQLYKHQTPHNILQTNGATGANFLVLYALLEAGDHVISLYPSYQQLYDIPKSLGCDVEFWIAREENDWLPDLEELKGMIRPNTKMICINNANNPTGAVMDKAFLTELVTVARSVGAYILSDEVYHPLTDEIEYEAICDLYEKGISTDSLSKTYSIPGVRVGWVAASQEMTDILRHYRDYTLICAGVFDDFTATYALKNRAALLERNRQLLSNNLTILKHWVESEQRATLSGPAYVSTSFVRLDVPIPIEEFCRQLLEETGVLVVPGNRFGYEGYIRIGYCCQEDVLKEGLSRLSDFIAKH